MTKHMKHGRSCDIEIWRPSGSSYFNDHSLVTTCIICVMISIDGAWCQSARYSRSQPTPPPPPPPWSRGHPARVQHVSITHRARMQPNRHLQGGSKKLICCNVTDISKARQHSLTLKILWLCEGSRTWKLATLILFVWLNIPCYTILWRHVYVG